MNFRWFLAAGLSMAPALLAGESLLQVPPGQAAVYEGTVKVSQSVEDTAQNEGSFTATLILIVSEGAKEGGAGKAEITAVRRLKTADEDARSILSFDDAILSSTPAGVRLEPKGETAPELEEGARELGFFMPLTLYPAETPAAGAELSGTAELTVLGSVSVKAPVVSKASKDGTAIVVTRSLKEGAAPEFTFRDETSKLTGWSQSFHFENTSSLPSKIETSFAIEGNLGGTKAVFRHNLQLDRKGQVAFKSEAGSKIEGLAKTLQGVGADFAAFKGADELAKKVDGIAESARGSILEVAVEPLRDRLLAYKASGLGTIAADFTLESLDGKQVSFREATKGKVTLLSFWGVG